MAHGMEPETIRRAAQNLSGLPVAAHIWAGRVTNGTIVDAKMYGTSYQ